MITRRTAAILLGSATLGLVAAATSPANAHPGHNPGAERAQGAQASDKARPAAARRAGARRAARGTRSCNIASAKLLTTENNDRLKAIDERLDQRVGDGDITQEQATKRFERIQKKVTIRVAMRTAKQAPVLTLFGVEDAAALRTAISEAGGVRALIEATEGVEKADFRDARREGRVAAREARADLCSSGESEQEEEASSL